MIGLARVRLLTAIAPPLYSNLLLSMLFFLQKLSTTGKNVTASVAPNSPLVYAAGNTERSDIDIADLTSTIANPGQVESIDQTRRLLAIQSGRYLGEHGS